RLHADFGQNGREAAVLERQPVGDRLRDRLDGERLARVADLVEASVGRREADAEPVGVGLPELGDVGRDLAGRETRMTRVERLEVSLDWGCDTAPPQWCPIAHGTATSTARA